MGESSPSLKVCSVCGGDQFTMNQFYHESGILLYWSAQTDVAENLWPRLNQGRKRLALSSFAAGSKRAKISVGFDCGSLSSAMFSPKDGRLFRQMESSLVNKRVR